jgi:molecular chaperone DnaJ
MSEELSELLYVGNTRVNPYNELNVHEGSDIDDIKASYQKLILLYHPDKQLNQDDTGDEKFKRVYNAWKILSDPILTIEYNKQTKFSNINPAYERIPLSGTISLFQ